MREMNYELAQARIADLKAMRHPQQQTQQFRPEFSFWNTFTGWWQSFRTPARKAPVVYRAELMRQEWMVNSEPVKEPKA